MTIEQAVDKVQVAWPATAGADDELTRQMRLGTRRKSRDLLMPDMNPLDLTLPANCIRQAVKAITNNAINPLDTRRGKGWRIGPRRFSANSPLLCAPRLQN